MEILVKYQPLSDCYEYYNPKTDRCDYCKDLSVLALMFDGFKIKLVG